MTEEPGPAAVDTDGKGWYISGSLKGVLSGSNSVVECDLAKVDVAGSNPVSRSKTQPQKEPARGRLFLWLSFGDQKSRSIAPIHGTIN